MILPATNNLRSRFFRASGPNLGQVAVERDVVVLGTGSAGLEFIEYATQDHIGRDFNINAGSKKISRKKSIAQSV